MRNESKGWWIGVEQEWESEVHTNNMNYTSISVYYAATSSVHIWVCACETALFYTYECLYPIPLLRKTQTNEVSCSALSHKRIPLMLINSLVRRPARTSPWESGKSGLCRLWGTYRVYSSCVQLNLSTPWPKHPYTTTAPSANQTQFSLGHFVQAANSFK